MTTERRCVRNIPSVTPRRYSEISAKAARRIKSEWYQLRRIASFEKEIKLEFVSEEDEQVVYTYPREVELGEPSPSIAG